MFLTKQHLVMARTLGVAIVATVGLSACATYKDEFAGIKNITRDDMLAGLRIPPQLMGVVPQNAGGFGSIRDAALVYAANELEPIQARMLQVNEWVGEEVIRFKPYELPSAAG